MMMFTENSDCNMMPYSAYEPLENGLKEVEVQRPLTQLKITLSLKAEDLDTKASGYQAPVEGEIGGSMDRILTRDDRGKERGKGKGRGRGKK